MSSEAVSTTDPVEPVAPVNEASPPPSTQTTRETLLRAWLSRWGLAALSLTYSLLVTMRTHSFYVWPWVVPVSNDEGYLAGMALRMMKGHWLPYVDGVSQRGPLLYWITALFMRAGGVWTWVPMRVLGWTLATTTISLVFALSATLWSPLAGAFASIACTYFLCYELAGWDGVGVNGEPLAVCFALAAALVIARMQLRPQATMKRRLWLAALAGFFVAATGLSKQMFLLHGVPVGLWILLGPRGEQLPWKQRWREIAALMTGFIAPYVLVVGVYAATGNLGRFFYYYQRYGREIFMAPLTREYIRDKFREQIDKYLSVGATLAFVWAALVSRAVRESSDYAVKGWLEKLRATPTGWFAALQMLLAFAGACFTFRFFPHYFVEFFPFAAVVVGGVAASPFRTLERGDRAGLRSAIVAVAGALVVLTVAHSARHRQVRMFREADRWHQDPQTDPITRYVAEKTRPDQSLFVWGFRAETYLSARRWPASRYVYTVYPSGVVPWFQATQEEEESRVVPGSRQEMLDDLEREQPELVVDAGRSMNGRYMYNYPQLRSYLDRHYCFMRYVDGEPIYRRRHGDRCPPADY